MTPGPSSPATLALALRSWIDGQREAERVSSELAAREPVTPAESLRRAEDLLTATAGILGWPLPADPARERGVAAVRATWVRLISLHRGAANRT